METETRFKPVTYGFPVNSLPSMDGMDVSTNRANPDAHIPLVLNEITKITRDIFKYDKNRLGAQ